MTLLSRAICIAASAHDGQFDKAGKPYIEHPLRVMLSVVGEKEKIVAVLHDVIEDTDISLEYLRENGFGNELLDALISVTRNEGETYFDFVRRAKENKIGRIVKRADLADNMNLSRLESLTADDFKRQKRYRKAMEILFED